VRETGELKLSDDEKVVLVGDVVSIADIAAYPTDKLAGVVSLEGSALSHTAVLSKALGLPAVMGVGHLSEFKQGELIIVDGHQGEVIITPPVSVLKEFEQLIDSHQALLRRFEKIRDLPAESSDGVRVNLFTNTGLLSDITPGLSCGAEGVGLYRSEMPFITSKSFPSEDEQYQIYRSVMEAYQGMPVYMRTLDVGGDKPLPYYVVEEDNPALGWRGVRFTLDHAAIFMTQIRAMLRASEKVGGLHIMLPMVSQVAEVDSFLIMLENACTQLKEEGVKIERPKVGVMAEVPAITSLIPFLAGKIDFVSIGTNDLSQYVLAVDRSNAKVTHISDPLHPAMIDAVEKIAQVASANGLELSVCGEMAADPCGVVLLLAMGVKTLSMVAFSIPEIKWVIRNISLSDSRIQLEQVRKYQNSEQTRAHLKTFLIDQGLGEIIGLGISQK
jgi:phosphotransferase system enzyme I (PtsI)/phosphotransferase system enzyme I (PtsP)